VPESMTAVLLPCMSYYPSYSTLVMFTYHQVYPVIGSQLTGDYVNDRSYPPNITYDYSSSLATRYPTTF
jgi:hypothetical protein